MNDSVSDSARETRDANGLLREELEGLQRRLGRQEKMQETLVDLELEKEVSQPVSGVLQLPGGPTSQLITRMAAMGLVWWVEWWSLKSAPS